MNGERRIIAAAGAVGQACTAGSIVLFGVDTLGTDVAQAIKVVALCVGALGAALSAGVQYYKGAL